MWARILNAMLGVWLMAAPQVLGYAGRAADNDHIVGPLVVSSTVVAMWEVTRPLRRVNTLLGTWLLLAPWLLGYESAATVVNSLVGGGLLIAFSLVRGRRRHRIGGGWSALWRSPEDWPAGASAEAPSAR